MSSARHAVTRGPSFTGRGKRPLLTPSHHVDFPTGIGPAGARMDARRRRPVSGKPIPWPEPAFDVEFSEFIR